MKSEVIFAGSAPLTGTVRQTQPGMNLMKPMAYYPGYVSEILSRGEYLFLSVHRMTVGPDDGGNLPDIVIADSGVTVKYRSGFEVREKKMRLED